MIRKSLFGWFLLCFIGFASPAVASEALAACASVQAPFQTLGQMVQDSAVQNPPQVQLCHRTANAFKHYRQTRKDKAIEELKKFIDEVHRSTPRHLGSAYADALIAEANRIIGLLDGTGGPILGQVSGGVFLFGTNTPVASATVTLQFPATGQVLTTVADQSGLFSFKELVPAGVFVISAQDGAGASGSGQGSLLETELTASVLIVIGQPGNGLIQGTVTSASTQPVPDALVTAMFPDTGRRYMAITGSDGQYVLSGVRTDGTVILIAFENSTGASASNSSVLTSGMPSRTVNFTLQQPAVVNIELTNSGFVDGLAGWTSIGPVQVIDRGLVFSTP